VKASKAYHTKSMDVIAEVLIRRRAKGLGKSSAICNFELQRSWLSSSLKLDHGVDVRHFLNGSSHGTLPVVGVSFDGYDDAQIVPSEPDHPVS